MGKDLEYKAKYIEDTTVYIVSGNIGIASQDDSTYMSAAATNRTDVWDLELPKGHSFDTAFLYIAYNWDKSGASGPVFNVTFNGKTMTPKAHYRDQSNLGKYGDYGYGLFVYDVSDLIKEGNNTLVLNKESGFPLNTFVPWGTMCLYRQLNKTNYTFSATTFGTIVLSRPMGSND